MCENTSEKIEYTGKFEMGILFTFYLNQKKGDCYISVEALKRLTPLNCLAVVSSEINFIEY